jgi:hypothetical protein
MVEMGRMTNWPAILKHGRDKREAREILNGLNWGRDCEGHELEYLDASEEYHKAKLNHRCAVQPAWNDRLQARNVRAIAATGVKLESMRELA